MELSATVLADNVFTTLDKVSLRRWRTNLASIKGVKKVKINLDKKEAIIKSKEKLDINILKKAITDLDYEIISIETNHE